MGQKLTVKKTHLICGTVIFLQLLSAQITKYWPALDNKLLYYMQYFCAAILFVAALGNERNKKVSLMIHNYIKMFYPFVILFAVVEAIALFSSPAVSEYGIRYWTRFAANVLNKICIFIEIASLVFLCKDKTIDCLSTTFIINGLFITAITVIRAGIVNTVKAFGAVFGIVESDLAVDLLEVHGLTYCFGICIIYYLFQDRRTRKENLPRVILMILLFILGGKRIAMGAIVVSGLFDIFVRRKGLSKTTISVFGSIGVAICITWIALLYNGEAMIFFSTHDINVMGRDVLNSYFIKRTEFGISHLGWGYAATGKLFENMSRAEMGNMVSVRGLHNDIFKIYIECGFVFGIVWYVLNLFYLPTKIFSRMGKKAATLYLTLTIFTFICYLTSNLEGDSLYQVVYLLMPLFIYIQERMKTEPALETQKVDLRRDDA